MARIPDQLDTGLSDAEVLTAFENALNNYPNTKAEVEEARGEHDNLGERLDEMSSDTPTPSTAAPAMDGTAAAGTSTDYARADHVHPSDTSKVDKETGKGLSTNDFTTAEKTKLDDLAEIKSIGTGLNLDGNGELTATGGGSGGTTNYNDLSNKPQINGNTLSGNKTSAQLGLASASDIPTVPIKAIQKNGTGITPVSGTVNITVPTTAADVSALPDTTKYAAALSLTINSSTFVMTGQLKDQNGDNLGTAQTIDLPLESVVVGGSYNSQTKKVVLTLQNGNTIEFSVADLVSGLQTELSASNKLNPAYINYDSTHRAVSDTEKSTWNGKQDALTAAQLAAVNSGINSEKVAQIETNKKNILLSEERNPMYNIFNFKLWANECIVYKGTKTVTENSITLTATGNTCITQWTSSVFPIGARVSASAGDKVVLLWESDNTTGTAKGDVWIFANGLNAGGTSIRVGDNQGIISWTCPAGTTFLTFGFGVTTNGDSIKYSNIRLIPKSLYDAGFTDYQPYAMSNVELTAAIQAIQAQLANQ